MQIPGSELALATVCTTLKKHQYNSVALQLPEGLKPHVFTIVKFLEQNTQATVFVSADPCFGACDIPHSELNQLGIEAVIQLGHTPLPSLQKFDMPTFFVNALSLQDVEPVVLRSLSLLEGTTIGLVTTAQHLHQLPTVTDILTNHHFKPIVSKGDKRIAAAGQILGCNFSAGTTLVDVVDSFLFIGSGRFHPLGLLLCTNKPVIVADPFTNTVEKEDLEELKDTILRQRYGAIARSKTAQRFGILIGTKQGQQRRDLAFTLRKLLQKHSKYSLFITLDTFSPAFLQGFTHIDCLVSTACPRIAIDDYLQYKIPILTPMELKILLGEKKWDDYSFDQITQ
jgi:2-(3-amino-3-carboxypropyl)histidine synthase